MYAKTEIDYRNYYSSVDMHIEYGVQGKNIEA